MTSALTASPVRHTYFFSDEDQQVWDELVDALTRRQLFVAGGVAALTAGCSTTRTSERTTQQPTRSVVDARGTQQIPSDINRVVCIDGGGDLELAALCGYEVVGFYDRSTAGVPYPISLQAAIAGDAARLDFEPNAEAVAALSPDLILLDSTYWADELGDKLTKIAPVLVAARTQDASPSQWRGDFEYFADALGRADVAREAFNLYDSTLDRLKSEHAAAISTATLNLIQTTTDGTGGGALPVPSQTLFGTIVNEVGGSFAAPQDSLVDRRELSAESISELRADVIVRTTYDLAPGAFAALDDNPLWQKLPAVADGRVVNAAVLVTNYGGPALATACIDVVAQAYSLAP